MGEVKKNSILMVDDQVSNINMLIHLLKDEYTLYAAKDGSSAIELAISHTPDLILLDIVMEKMDGYKVLQKLREIDATNKIPVIFITGLDSKEDEEKGLALEVADYISKPFTPGIVKLRVRNQIRMINYMREIEKLSMTDALTGLSNRRSFNIMLEKEWSRATREQQPLSIIVLDIDKFKYFNDNYGHQHGDMALQTVAEILNLTIKRRTDYVARWGGEEFVILLPSTDVDGAARIAERVRVEIERASIPHPDGFVTKATISAGVTGLIPDMDSVVDKFVSDADKALYSAKQQGRNRVVKGP